MRWITAAAMTATLMVMSCGQDEKSEERAAIPSLRYLDNVEEIAEYTVVGNNVVISFRARPDDLTSIVRAAAVNANIALGGAARAWAVDAADYTGNIPKESFICDASAQNGRVSDSTCK